MEHYTRNTVSVSAYCSKCGKKTQHREKTIDRYWSALMKIAQMSEMDGAISADAKRIAQEVLFGEITKQEGGDGK